MRRPIGVNARARHQGGRVAAALPIEAGRAAAVKQAGQVERPGPTDGLLLLLRDIHPLLAGVLLAGHWSFDAAIGDADPRRRVPHRQREGDFEQLPVLMPVHGRRHVQARQSVPQRHVLRECRLPPGVRDAHDGADGAAGDQRHDRSGRQQVLLARVADVPGAAAVPQHLQEVRRLPDGDHLAPGLLVVQAGDQAGVLGDDSAQERVLQSQRVRRLAGQRCGGWGRTSAQEKGLVAKGGDSRGDKGQRVRVNRLYGNDDTGRVSRPRPVGRIGYGQPDHVGARKG